jgi:hypothetical protein
MQSVVSNYTLRAQSEGGNTSVLNSLNITNVAFGKLDLADDRAIVDYTAASPASAIRGYITQGYAGGSWSGNGITSALAAAVASNPALVHKTAIGYGEASALGAGSFGGITLDGSDVLMRYTFNADANLDGTVNTVDFTRLAAAFNSSTGLWTDGDFNYDGKTNALDFNALAANFGSTLPSGALGTLVPEPQALMAAFCGTIMMRRWRRRRCTRRT